MSNIRYTLDKLAVRSRNNVRLLDDLNNAFDLLMIELQLVKEHNARLIASIDEEALKRFNKMKLRNDMMQSQLNSAAETKKIEIREILNSISSIISHINYFLPETKIFINSEVIHLSNLCAHLRKLVLND